MLLVQGLDSDVLLLKLFIQIRTSELLYYSANFNFVDTNSYYSYLIRRLHYTQGIVVSIVAAVVGMCLLFTVTLAVLLVVI